ncbi:MAG: hypothetical protein R3E66_11370 [bacterium]
MKSHIAFAALCAAIFGAPAVSFAQSSLSSSAEAGDTSPFGYGFEYRVWGQNADANSFTGDPDTEATAYQRLRLDADVTFSSIRFDAELEAASGRLTGDLSPALPERVDTGTRANDNLDDMIVDPYEAFLTWNASVAQIRVGLQKSGFGMGMVANDGVESDDMLFNQKFGADRGLRVLLATKPFAAFATSRKLKNVYLAVGGDMVWRDDNADFLEGDRAYQFVGSTFYRDEDPRDDRNSTFVGFYTAIRSQEDREVTGVTPNDTLDVMAFDVAAKKSFVTDSDIHVTIGAEAALLSGESTRAYSQNGEAKTDILGLGAAGELMLRWNPAKAAFKLLTGYASGDANPDDDTLYRFRFDPNYKVGLVMFDQYIPAATREAYTRVTDPERSGVPQRGVFGLINDGAIEDAIYVNPQLLLGDPDGLLTGVGALWAWSAVPFADPYASFANGGTPTGVNGRGEASRQLGFEVDVSARYRRKLVKDLMLEVKAEYGILFPGAAFEDASGVGDGAQNLVRGRIALSW